MRPVHHISDALARGEVDAAQARLARQEALAERVQEILLSRHGIKSDRHAGDGVAMLIISTELVAWFYPQFVQWQTGHKSTRRPGHAIMATASVADPPETIARRLAERYRQIRQEASGPDYASPYRQPCRP